MPSGQLIRTEVVTACLLCKGLGITLYEGLSDRLWGSRGIWGFKKCRECGLIWLHPRPVIEDSIQAYADYQTHSTESVDQELHGWRGKTKLAIHSAVPGYSALADGWSWRWLGRALRWVPLLVDIRELGVMALGDLQKGKLLEVGCGNGLFLSLMKRAGWDVQGVEPDTVAAKLAEELFHIPVFPGPLPEAHLPDSFFDAVVLSHVIEHAHDPLSLLKECRRVAKPQGRVVVLTPNSESLGHKIFQASWRDLDPPRHLYLFSMETLRETAAKSGIHVDDLRTSSRIARGVWTTSRIIQNHGVYADDAVNWRLRLGGMAFQLKEERARRISEKAGEELVLIGSPGS